MSLNPDLLERLGSMDQAGLDRLVYLVGSARGGTSLCLNLIGAHPEVCSFIGPSHFFNQLWRYRKVVHERVLRVLFWAALSTDQDDLFASMTETQRDAANALYALGFKKPSMRGLYDLYPLFRALDPAVEHPDSGYRAWFDKSNDANGLEEIAAAYPDARFLFVFRDPRGAVPTLTTRAAMQTAQENHITLGGAITQAIYWCNLTQRILLFAALYPDRSLLLAYERLVTEPTVVLSEVFSFLGLNPVSTDRLTAIIENVGYGSTFEATGIGLNTTPITRWRTAIDQDVIDVIARICGQTARKIGYDLSYPVSGTPGMARILGHVSGAGAKATTLAKLIYLASRESSTQVMAPGGSAPQLLWSPRHEATIATDGSCAHPT